jgi:hypothetical protein
MKKVTIPQQAVVFGTERIASIWALRNDVPRENVVLATQPDKVKKLKGPVTVVRVKEEEWKPSTFPDENRVKDSEQHLKDRKHKKDDEVVEVKLEQ